MAMETSTSAAKAVLVDREKGILDMAMETFGPEVDREGAQDTEAVLRAALEVGRRVARGRDIQAVALGGIWHSVVLLDDRMRPQGRTYTWAYRGAAGSCRNLRLQEGLAEELYRRTGCMVHASYPRQVLLDMKERGVPLKGKRIASQGACLFQRLTGEFMESVSTASGSGWLHLEDRNYDPQVLDLLGIRVEQLGLLGSYRDVRPLTSKGAALLGIAPGIPVVPSHPDGALNQVGDGASLPGRMTFSVGTSGALRLTKEAPALTDKRQTWCYAGVEDWVAGAATSGAGNCVRWFKEKVLGGKWGYPELERGGVSLEAPVGPGAVFLPFLFGERSPGWNDGRRGGFVGLEGTEDAAGLYTVLREGILFNLLQGFQALLEASGEPRALVLSGGILHSPQWTQMAADIFQRPLHCSDTSQASVLGAAALALHAAGGLEEVKEFASDWSGLRVVEPRRDRGELYGERFGEYCRWYGKTI
nr:FGGY-family carbohydrate kinase [Anaerotalea alkaliphila]